MCDKDRHICAVDKEGDDMEQEQIYARWIRRVIAWDKGGHIRALNKKRYSVRQGQTYSRARR